MLTMEELQEMKNMDIMQADRGQLTDIGDIQIDSSKSPENRILDYLEQVHNPYFVKAGDYILKFQYAEKGKSMDEQMAEYVSRLAKIRY